ncbi:MAG TPA: hypothetical protein VGU03_07440 [Frateuria sp.]|uniref:hypothetical protein n=1 Tax=Frateuria sp. TaxID=2211372 RepID=UPI002DEC3055|nr:hypothetical protein [Frateuria sp.]
MWFDSIASTDEPGRRELQGFVYSVRDFLAFVLEQTDAFGFLWESHPELREQARETFALDVAERGVPELLQAIDEIPSEALHAHGLEGRPLRFKLRVLNAVASLWPRLKPQLSIRDWLKKIIDAIDAILGSLVEAAGGAGGIIKEFKDALSALA